MLEGSWSYVGGNPNHVTIRAGTYTVTDPQGRVVLSAAMQDFIDEVKPSDDGDWLTLSRAARGMTRERIEDYVAAAAASGPLMPDTGRAPEQ